MAGRLAGLAATAVLTCALVVAAATGALADGPPAGTIGSFPTWSLVAASASGQTFAGSASFSTAAAFPSVSWTTNASTAQTPSGQSAFLGASTGFGQNFGSTRAQPYLYLSPASGGPSTTTITFGGQPPAGWGFAVGDIDADFVEIIPHDSTGASLSGADLNAQDTTGTPLLNYCNNSPKPSTCVGPGPFTDFPTWHPTGVTVGATTYTTPVVLGSGSDTSGAYDWFLPGPDVRSLTFVFHVQSGFPTYQIWLAALAPSSTISGSVVAAGGGGIPNGVDATLAHTDGSPVLDLLADPVSVPVAPNGSFAMTAEQGTYEIAFNVPPGYDPIPAQQVVAAAATVTADPVALTLAAALPATGVDASGVAATGVALAAVGWVLVLVRRRSRSHPMPR